MRSRVKSIVTERLYSTSMCVCIDVIISARSVQGLRCGLFCRDAVAVRDGRPFVLLSPRFRNIARRLDWKVWKGRLGNLFHRAQGIFKF